MKIFKNFNLLTLFVIITITGYGQEIEHQAPTLQAGLDGLSFTKGTLDPEIIARIIAKKQNEIKLRIIQNSFLQNIYGSGGTIYNYADNVIKGVVQEPDTDVRTRKILESTVNLVFVYAFVDFYLREVSKDTSAHTNLKNLAIGYELPNLIDFSTGLRYRDLLELNPPNEKTKINLRGVEYQGLTSKRTIDEEDDYLNKFMSLLIDMSSEVVRHNTKLRDLGLMRVSYSTNYDYLNLYKQQQNYYSFKKDDLINKTNKDLADKVYADMCNFMQEYTNYIGALKYILEFKSFKSNDLSSNSIKLSNYSNPLDYLNFPAQDIKLVIDKLSKAYTRASENNEHIDKNYIKDLKTAIEKLTSSLSYIKNIKQYLEDPNITTIKKALIISDMLYTIKMDIIPNIDYSIKFAPSLIGTKDEMINLSQEIYSVLVTQVPNLKTINQDPEPFIQLVSKLYEFDRSKTFSEYTKLITLLDEIFETGNFKNALSTINTFVKDYTVIKEDENGKEVLEFNVESFLVKLDNIQSDKIRRFEFHFTVGLNTTSFLNGDIDIGDGEEISNLSHFSEKIGLKFKIINRGDWLPKNPGESYGSFGYSYIKRSPPKEPLISNWHVLLYGSGILYTVINSSTNKRFNYPMVGFGTGITFYNALDFNVSIGIPILESGGFDAMTDNPFIGFGFDIQIGEYLKEVGKKRKAKKQNEQLLSKS